MKKRHLAALSTLTLASSLHAEVVSVTPTLDVYNYSAVTDGATRLTTSVFAFQNTPLPDPQFSFDYRDAHYVAQFPLAVPPALAGGFNVTSAVLTVYNKFDVSGGANWDPTAGDLELWASGFTGTNGFTETTWTGNYVGSNASSSIPRDPYPRDLATDAHAENDPTATPWALGTPEAGYTGTPAATAPVLITFMLDTNNPTVQAELQSDFASGLGTWTITSTFVAAQPPTPSFFPRLATVEGVADATPKAPAAATLTMTLVSNAGVGDWTMY